MLPLLTAVSCAISLAAASPTWTPTPAVTFLGPIDATPNSVSNIHVSYELPDLLIGDIAFAYGDCELEYLDGAHHHVGRFSSQHYSELPTRFVWLTPDDVPHAHCLHAFSESGLLGRSEPINVLNKPLQKRQTLSQLDNPYGAWFDGVAYLQSKDPSDAFVAKAKDQKIGIIGAGMSGLFSALLLDSVGIYNWEITEMTDRIGGRLRTAYLGGSSPEDYQYQEMGPMRFPLSYTLDNETLEIQDHKLVFQMADELNYLNKEADPEWQVNFIPWIQSNPNTYQYVNNVRNPDGTTPRRNEYSDALTAANITATVDEDSEAYTDAVERLEELVAFEERERLSAHNIFKAHKQAIEDGLGDWSESLFLKYNTDLDWDETSAVLGTGFLFSEIYDGVYFSASEWLTVDKGLSRLGEAFHPIVDDRLTLNRRIQKISFDEKTNKTAIHWRDNPFDRDLQSSTYDKTIVAAPFSTAKLWNIDVPLSDVMQEAIDGLGQSAACKVALLYETRFWEQMENPIYGGCGSTDIPGIGSFCYPAYNINATGPGALLAAYDTGTGPNAQGLSEEEHVGLVYQAMIDIHGEVAREQYTGSYNRQCWGLDPLSISWASPYAGQHERYMPEYHKVHGNHIFVGEHTSVNHAWIFSALESGVRGVVQLLLEDGLVDEAKQIVDKWMARWISV